jgi:hypothetical protein
VPTKPADEVDALYALPLGEFVGARNELAKQLRQEGRKEEAERVAGLPKPTVAAWAANQLARRERRDVDLLLDAGHRMRAAHKERDAEKARQAIESARDAERDAIRRLVSSAEKLLEEGHGSATRGTLDRVAATLRAAAVTEEGRELLARGQLSEELSTTGFELVASLAPSGGRRATSSARRREQRATEVADAREALKEAKAREREAARDLRDAEKEAAAAEARLEDARALADEAAKEVKAAETALDRAQRQG